ncbi:MAG TPA: DUF2243 domain-containing protein [Candidatus Limnocylindrales bacterium]
MTSRPGLIDSRFRVPTILLGIGLGGFFDGIVLHQVLQWHHLLSTPYPPDSLANLELNTLADGIFHLATWAITALAVVAVWMTVRETGGRPSWRVLVGGALTGWGGFNVVEGIVDHQLLGIHHVRPGADALLWDIGFLAWGALMLVAGLAILRRARPA